MLPDYRFDPASGQWRHRRGTPSSVAGLDDLAYVDGELHYRSFRAAAPVAALRGYLEEAKRLAQGMSESTEDRAHADPVLAADLEQLRWFTLPGEALAELGNPASG